MKFIYLWSLVFFFLIIGCSKKDFLDEKPNQSHVVPTTLSELQAILDRDLEINGMGNGGRGPVPNLGEIAAGDFYISDVHYNTGMNSQFQNYYRWEKDVYDGSVEVASWRWPYQVVFSANVVLDGLKKIESNENNKNQYDETKGAALFIRAHAFYQLSQVFAPPYEFGKDNSAFGIMLRESADLNEKLMRSTVKETHGKIIEDLGKAISLLPIAVKMKTRPSKIATYGLMARVYLSMQDYDQALLYADSCLNLQSDLLDYNELNSNLTYPFQEGDFAHKEVLFSAKMVAPLRQPLNIVYLRFKEDLIDLFQEGDLRKSVSFYESPTGIRYKGYYHSGGIPFAGVSVDEIYLIRAECNARKGNVVQAMDELNRLVETRWDEKIQYSPLVATNAKEALTIILQERRKQLLLRGTRWTDLRRLNLEGSEITLEREINGTKFTLPPNDARYTYPIPMEVSDFYIGQQ